MEAVGVGLTIGSSLALTALGLVLIFGVMRTINFAHGEFYTLGGYAFVLAANSLGLSPWLSILAAPIVGWVVGWVMHRVLLTVRPALSRFSYSDYFILITFAVATIMQSGWLVALGAGYRKPPSLLEVEFQFFGITVGGDRIAVVLGMVVVLIALTLYMRHSYTGRAWRALASNRLGAEVVGIDVVRESRSSFATAVAIAAFSGALLAPLLSVFPSVGNAALSTGFIIIVLGGMGSVPGAVIGGLLVGVVDTLGVVYISSAYSGIYGFLLMIVVLLVRPVGLFGTRVRSI
ncbi:MAG: branched-chain amino acid ABC transporter permease [Actinomycetota bacterium]|nr:branched-chain amino acid ABC transporter permease [Actinomycetota bacterium]